MTRHRKKRKKGLIGLMMTLVLLIACIAVTAVFFLWGQNSEEKRLYEAQLKQETQEFTEELVTELDQVDISEDGLQAENSTASSTEVPSGVITEAEKQVIGEALGELEDERKRQVLQILSVAYSQALAQQKQEAFRMAENLIAQGKADWAALVAKGENTAVNKGTLVSEYLAKSKVMEGQMDASFASLTQKMESQLNAEGIDPTAIIAQYQAEYEEIKSANKSALMEKVMDAAKN